MWPCASCSCIYFDSTCRVVVGVSQPDSDLQCLDVRIMLRRWITDLLVRGRRNPRCCGSDTSCFLGKYHTLDTLSFLTWAAKAKLGKYCREMMRCRAQTGQIAVSWTILLSSFTTQANMSNRHTLKLSPRLAIFWNKTSEKKQKTPDMGKAPALRWRLSASFALLVGGFFEAIFKRSWAGAFDVNFVFCLANLGPLRSLLCPRSRRDNEF